MNKTLILLFMMVSSFFLTAAGQTLPPIQTDRPDQTECPFLVPAKHFQAEIGLTSEHTGKNSDAYLYPSILWKYGVNNKFELRLITEITGEKDFRGRQSGLGPVTIGFKTALAEEKGILPKISFIGHLSLPAIASEKLKATFYAPAFRFTLQHSLSEKISLGYNLGAEWDGETPEPIFIYTITTGFSLSEKLGAYVELYGFAPQQSRVDHRFDAGFTYLVKNNVMVDLSGGIGITENAPDYFASVGFSFRLKD